MIRFIKYTIILFITLFTWLYFFQKWVHADNRIPIAIIDSGIYDSYPDKVICGKKDFTNTGITDVIGHGTLIADIIAKNLPPGYCLLIIKWFHSFDASFTSISSDRVADSIYYAIEHQAKYINLSLTGPGAWPSEKMAILTALQRGIKVIVAAGNDSVDLGERCNNFPACYLFTNPNFYVVGALDDSNSIASYSNYGSPVKYWQNGTGCFLKNCFNGTSIAAPRMLRKLLK